MLRHWTPETVCRVHPIQAFEALEALEATGRAERALPVGSDPPRLGQDGWG